MGISGCSVAISAHRGGCEGSQAETIEAYASSLRTGAEYVEFDTRRTADGELVVYHDAYTPQANALASITYKRLRELAGYEVPRVVDVMQLIAGKAMGHLDLKETGYEHELVELALGILGKGTFIVTSLEDSSIAAIRADFSDVAAALSLGRKLRTMPASTWIKTRANELFPMGRIRACGADWAALNQRFARVGVLSQCHRSGIKAMIWTANSDKDIAYWLADPRVSVLVTDRPGHAVSMRAALKTQTTARDRSGT
jgi:glycerophosphoryl diester phosphodiesterase